eukprot:TRINITY_DN751_c4_g1_i1.p1 TRINITY_DN751_c4_g1~~TRINITY_DN751_c4_g1_i1.p1  ORF type:complete len:489 (+),score=60.03 TRINITY_DN751_c4_g1_i1:66-1469(+)
MRRTICLLKSHQSGQGSTHFAMGLNPGDNRKARQRFAKKREADLKDKLGKLSTDTSREAVRAEKLKLGGTKYRDFLCFEILDEKNDLRILRLQELLDELMVVKATLTGLSVVSPSILEAVADMKKDQSKFNMARVLIRTADSVPNSGLSTVLLSEAGRLCENHPKLGSILVRLSHSLLLGGHYLRSESVVRTALDTHNLTPAEITTGKMVLASCLYNRDPEECISYLEENTDIPDSRRISLLEKAREAIKIGKQWDGVVIAGTEFLVDGSEIIAMCAEMNHWSSDKNLRQLASALQTFCTDKSVKVKLLFASGVRQVTLSEDEFPDLSILNSRDLTIKRFPPDSILVSTNPTYLYMARSMKANYVRPLDFLFKTVSNSMLPDGCENVAKNMTDQGHFPSHNRSMAPMQKDGHPLTAADYKELKFKKFQRHMGVTDRAVEIPRTFAAKVANAHKNFGIVTPGVLQTNL